MSVIDWERMLAPMAPWAYVMISKEADVDTSLAQLGYEHPDHATGVRVIRGVRCPTKRRLLQEFAAALQFPWYFGENFDALEECINDLSWLPAPAYVIILTNVHELLPKEDEQFGVLMAILRKASDDWRDPASRAAVARGRTRPFHVVFHTRYREWLGVRRRLETAGIQIPGIMTSMEDAQEGHDPVEPSGRQP